VILIYSLYICNTPVDVEKILQLCTQCGGHIVILIYSLYICNTPVDVEKILQLCTITV